MRRWMIALALLVPALAQARPARIHARTPATDPERANFWRRLLWPHKDEVDAIVTAVRNGLVQGDNAPGDFDPTGSERVQFFGEVFGALRYAHQLAPDNVEVLQLLGEAADEIGKTRAAIDALRLAISHVGIDKAGPELTGRLGAIYLRRGELDEALRYLRLAQLPLAGGQPTSAEALVYLSTALALHGETPEAIDVLANNVPPVAAYYTNELALVAFALAVQLDRDDQRGAAFTVIDHMQAVLQGELGTRLQIVLGQMRFAPVEDRQYYDALLYEVLGNYTEARAAWMLYAASDQPYRARALEHVAAIDAVRRAPRPAAAATASPSALPRVRGIPNPPPVPTP